MVRHRLPAVTSAESSHARGTSLFSNLQFLNGIADNAL
jgi:hypothetical protein